MIQIFPMGCPVLFGHRRNIVFSPFYKRDLYSSDSRKEVTNTYPKMSLQTGTLPEEQLYEGLANDTYQLITVHEEPTDDAYHRICPKKIRSQTSTVFISRFQMRMPL